MTHVQSINKFNVERLLRALHANSFVRARHSSSRVPYVI